MNLRRRLNLLLPEYTWIPLITEFVLNSMVYGGAKIIASGWHHYNMETALDQKIPFLPWTVLIYFGCYLFWAANYVLSSRQGREEAYTFLSADFLAKWICLVFFLLLPTTNTRPSVPEGGIWNTLMRFLYWIDSPENLFPSIHCLTSWFCYIGIRGRKNVSVFYRAFSLLFALAVCVSTLTTKQHVILDVVGGVALAELSYWAAGHTGLAKWYGALFEQRLRKGERA